MSSESGRRVSRNRLLDIVAIVTSSPIGEFAQNLYDLPHDALVLSGAYGHGLIKNMLFGSKVEITQATLTNNMLVSGPHSKTHLN